MRPFNCEIGSGGSLPPHVWGYYLWDEPYENRTDQPRLDMYEWLKSIQGGQSYSIFTPFGLI